MKKVSIELLIVAVLFTVLSGCHSFYIESFDEYDLHVRFHAGDIFTTVFASFEFLQRDWAGGGYALIDNRQYSSGYCKDMNLNNISLRLVPGNSVRGITITFGELGGRVELCINGSTSSFQNLIDANNMILEDVHIYVSATQVGNNWYGKIQLQGPINELIIGGQELWIDNITFESNEQSQAIILFDARQDIDQSYIGSFSEYKNALRQRGYTVNHLTSGEITSSLLSSCNALFISPYHYQYSSSEKEALLDYVTNGGSVLIVGEWGPGTQYQALQNILDVFSVVTDNNKVTDTLHSEGEDFWILYSSGNFTCHPVIQGISEIGLYAGSTLTASGWNTIIQTYNDSNPPEKPVVISKSIGMGRVIVIGDSDVFYHYSEFDNKQFTLQLMDWLLFKK